MVEALYSGVLLCIFSMFSDVTLVARSWLQQEPRNLTVEVRNATNLDSFPGDLVVKPLLEHHWHGVFQMQIFVLMECFCWEIRFL